MYRRIGTLQYSSLSRDLKRGRLNLSQSATIDKLPDRFGITSSNPLTACCSTLLGVRGPEEARFEGRYLEAVGVRLWIANISKPDISNAAGEVVRYSNDSAARYWEAVRKDLSSLMSTRQLRITFCGGTPDKLQAFADPLYAPQSDDRRSTSGGVLIFCGGPSTWFWRTHKQISLSRTKAGCVAGDG